MADSTYEEAKRCPKCEEPGNKINETAARSGQPGVWITPGTRVHHFQCKNPRCKWFDGAPWLVQVNPDGTIPPANTHRQKTFPELPRRSDAEVEQAIQAMYEQTRTGGETR